MKTRALIAALTIALLLLICLFVTAPKYPVALIRVVDAAGKPIRGAIITPDGMRTKPGPYQSGHYGWAGNSNAPPVRDAITGADGFAMVPYPKYVVEKLETGQISFSVRHPDYVPDRPFRVVTTTPPQGAPWKEWADYLIARVKQRAIIARTEPVVLQPGATVKLSVTANAPPAPATNQLYAQMAGLGSDLEGFWTNPAPNVVLSRQVQPGTHLVRLIQFDNESLPWFSDVASLTATTNQATELALDLRRGVSLTGKLDSSVPRPVKRGRVIAHITPVNTLLKDGPPQWHAWTEITEDGAFRFASLPSGTLEIYALCDGFISTNGPGKFHIRYPQQHLIGTNDLFLEIGMEPSARLEVTVLDDTGKPLPNAKVYTWPNIRYGEWSATMFGGDCYNTRDYLQKPPSGFQWAPANPDIEGTTDSNGVAILASLPADVNSFGVAHPAFRLPITDNGGQKQREAQITLTAAQTSKSTVRLEPLGKSEIAHY